MKDVFYIDSSSAFVTHIFRVLDFGHAEVRDVTLGWVVFEDLSIG
jgi:hypothetical protein